MHAQHARPAHRPPHHHWRRYLVEPAALFTAVAVADIVANLVGHGPDGSVLLIFTAPLLLATVGFHTWWARRHSHVPSHNAPPATVPTSDTPTPAASASGLPTADSTARTTLWRLRTTVQDIPGSLAALCTAMAERGIDILSLQTHPLAGGTVDEFLLRMPAELTAADLSRTVSEVGGDDTWVERADAHDLVDPPPGCSTSPCVPHSTRPSYPWPCAGCSAAARSVHCPPVPTGPPTHQWKAPSTAPSYACVRLKEE